MNVIDKNETNAIVDKLFRQLAGQLTATLSRILGVANIDLAESIVQDAFLKACEVWPHGGIPPNPAAWITTVAKNRSLDLIRNRKVFSKIEPELVRQFELQIDRGIGSSLDEAEMIDDQLKMMLLTCHPVLSRKAQVSLTLKVCSGFSTGEIARAFLTGEEAIRKMISRSKLAIRAVENPFEWPTDSDFSERVGSVLDALYLMFNEGYLSFEGDLPFRADLCDEAIRLALLFLRGSRPVPNASSVRALLALMLLHSSRFPARTDSDGNPVLLENQNRLDWDRERINWGVRLLRESLEGDQISTFHYEAQIAAAHSLAESYAQTDWPRIAKHYDALYAMTGSPVVALNRAVAISNFRGIDEGIAALKIIESSGDLRDYYLLPATFGHFYFCIGNRKLAMDHYQKALQMTKNASERTFISNRIKECS